MRWGLAALVAAMMAGDALAQPMGLRAARWLDPNSDRVRALTIEPTECLLKPTSAAQRLSVETGRAAFRTPILLGGQAARAGVACETCHRNGRTNPDFLFPGVSGAAGTADVTSSLFSSHRGNGIEDPKPIPDLSGPRDRLKISQAPADRALEPFIHGLITQEFDGPEPSPAVLQGLADYVRGLSPSACPKSQTGPVSPHLLMVDARRAVQAGDQWVARGDFKTATLMIAAARSRLYLIDERYQSPSLSADKTMLRSAAHDLARVAEAVRTGAPTARTLMSRWLASTAKLDRRLTASARKSLFNPRRLEEASQRPLPREAS